MSRHWCILLLLLSAALCQGASLAGSLPATDIDKDPDQNGIIKVMGLRIMQGFPDGTFRPSDSVNEDALAKVLERFLAVCPSANDGAFVAKDRAQEVSRIRAIAVILRYAANGKNVEATLDPQGKLARFSDSGDVPAWALKPAAFAAEHELLDPAATTLRPNEPISRGELAGVIARAVTRTAGTIAQSATGLNSSEAKYTGLVIDCRGLGLSRSMCPEIICEQSGRLYPDPKCAPSVDFVQENGLVAYANELSQASRAGSKPLVVVALSVSGTAKQAAVISEVDKKVILDADKECGFLSRWNVVFLKD